MSGNKEALVVVAAGAACILAAWKRRALLRKLPPNSAASSDLARFQDRFPALVEEFLQSVASDQELSAEHTERLRKMFFYTCSGGKMNRGLAVVITARDICRYKCCDFNEIQDQATVLGWCIEILQACFLVADDIMDKSETRRGKPCWYKLPEIEFDAVNDTLLLESFIWFLLKKHFSGMQQYVALVHLFQEVSLQTQIGQMLDLTTQPKDPKQHQSLHNFNLDLYYNIIIYKTAFYTFYLPFASAMILCGVDGAQELQVARQISVELGRKFQIQDDFIDCFGDPNITGKVGTDIQDRKCSWLVVQALLRVNRQQRLTLESLYGKHDPQSITRVKDLYRELDLVSVYRQQETDSYALIIEMIEASRTVVPSVADSFKAMLDSIHGREK